MTSRPWTKLAVITALALPFAAPSFGADGDGLQDFVANADVYTLTRDGTVIHTPAPNAPQPESPVTLPPDQYAAVYSLPASQVYGPSTAPQVYVQPTAPAQVYVPPTAPQVYVQPTAPGQVYVQPTAPAQVYVQPTAPAQVYVPSTAPQVYVPQTPGSGAWVQTPRVYQPFSAPIDEDGPDSLKGQ